MGKLAETGGFKGPNSWKWIFLKQNCEAGSIEVIHSIKHKILPFSSEGFTQASQRNKCLMHRLRIRTQCD